jgi:hypothetical protein
MQGETGEATGRKMKTLEDSLLLQYCAGKVKTYGTTTDRVGTGEKPAERRDPQKNDGDLAGGGGEGSLRLTRNRGTSPEVSDSRRRRWRGRGGAVQLGKADTGGTLTLTSGPACRTVRFAS